MPMCCFGVPLFPDGGSGACFDGEDDARRRDHDRGGPADVTLCLGPAEFAALSAVVSAYRNRVSHHPRVLEELYELLTGRESHHG
jgi:hypothetical protein